MVTVAAAEEIIMSEVRDYGTETVPFQLALGRVLAEDIKADRDLPPCNRVTMDGIAISYAAFEEGTRSFRIKATVAAGDVPIDILADECVEIMTGAALPDTADTVVRYEDVRIENGLATVLTEIIKKSQNIHRKGKDKTAGDIVAGANQVIDATVVSMAASVGRDMLLVYKLPRVVILSTGDELVGITEQPTPYQVRTSNSYTVQAVLQRYKLDAAMLHLPDEPGVIKEILEDCVAQYDVIILSGGVSMGKFDYIPQGLEELSVTKLFHKVQQRPGKPFWFGKHAGGALVFAFPGNPVSTFMCLHRYFVPWLLQIQNSKLKIKKNAMLAADISFAPALQYFVQVKLEINDQAQVIATPVEGNGSGDFANLLDSDAFMELPREQSNFKKGEVHRIWPFKQVL